MAKKNTVQEQYSSKGGTTITITIKDEQDNPINGVTIKKSSTTDLLGTTNSTGVAMINAKMGDQLVLEKEGYVPELFTLPQMTTVTARLSEKIVVSVIDENGNPLTGVDVIAFDRDGKPYDLSAEAIIKDGTPTGQYVFNEVIDSLGTIRVSLLGFLEQTYNVNKKAQLNVQLFSDTPEHRDLLEVKEEYELISRLITGNYPDNDTVDEKCLIKIPDINRKIKERLNQ